MKDINTSKSEKTNNRKLISKMELEREKALWEAEYSKKKL